MINIFRDGISIQFCKNYFTQCHILDVFMLSYYDLIIWIFFFVGLGYVIYYLNSLRGEK
jgi:hypothetical protein